MKKVKLALIFFAIFGAVLAIFLVLDSDRALVTHPKGIIADSQLHLIGTNYLLMLTIVVPTLICLYAIAWKYRAKNSTADYEPENEGSYLKELILWILPLVIVVPLAVITWQATHKLDPYQPLESERAPLTIQVIALDWKWLFIYPEQGIATLNFVQFPEKTPIRFELSADGSPMNSFWIPELSGQIYAMAGMSTTLHMMADAPGVYAGRAAEINGEGFADMTFVVQSTSQSDFEEWTGSVKQSPLQLTDQNYKELVKPSKKNPITLYSYVEKDLYHKTVMKYMHP